MAVLVPLGLLAALVILQSYRDWKEAQNLRDLEPLMAVSQSSIVLVQSVQRERGLTLLNLGTSNVDTLKSVRNETDRAFERFRAVAFGDSTLSSVGSELRKLLTELDTAVIALPRARDAVDAGQADWDTSFEFYNDLNRVLTNVAAALAQGVENGPVLRQMLPAVMLQKAGEEASKAAAAGAVVIARAAAGQPFGKAFVRFYEANTEDLASTSGFFRLASTEQIAGFGSSADQIGSESFHALRQKLATLPGTKDLTGLDAKLWYQAAASRLDQMNVHTSRLVLAASDSARDQISKAEFSFFYWLILSGVFVVVSLGVTASLAFPLSNQILSFRKSLLALANGEFDAPIPFRERNDEIGETARALDMLREGASEQALVQETLKATHRSMSEGILILSSEGVLTDANQGAVDFFKMSAEGDAPIHVSELLPDDPLASLGNAIATQEKRNLVSRDRDASALIGGAERCPVRLSVAQMNVRDRKLFTVVVSDMSERARIAEDLQKAADIARSADIAKGNFLANMSHEIRTPLHGIIGLARLMSVSGLDEEQQDHLSKILTSTELLLGIINDILDFSKIDAGELDLEETDFSLHDLVESVVDLFTVQASSKAVVLRSTVAPDVPDALRGDPLRVSQVLINLVGNAVKFTEKGSVNVSVGFDVRSAGGFELILSVRDTGQGLGADQIANLFKPFTQADATTTRRFGGSGLGLAIARGIANRMGGDITVESELGLGSTFTARVQVARAVGGTLVSRNSERILGHDSLEPMHILVAEDNEVNQIVAQGTLEKLGMTVDVVTNGAEAIRTIQDRGAGCYDLVFMDIQMPVMDGFEAVGALRKDRKYDSLPIVSMTAHAFTSEREKCLSVGMQDHISKPFRMEDLRRMLVRWSPANRPTELDLPVASQND